MRKRSTARSLLVVSLVALVFALPASAEKGGHGKDGGKPDKGASHGAAKDHGHSQGKSAKKFEDAQRKAIDKYYKDEYSSHGNCPPGLKKKGNGCMPPGAKRWNVGAALPPDVILVPVPPPLRATLAVPLPGYDYGYVDGEVVLFGVSDRIVIDFVAVY